VIDPGTAAVFTKLGPEAQMRTHHFSGARLAFAIVAFVCALNARSILAKDPPSDLCSLLAPSALEKVIAQPFSAAEKSTAPAAFAGQPSGTHCEYAAQKGAAIKVVFIAYVDPSAALAKQTFEKLSVWYAPESWPAIGDSSYVDAHHAIHVLKGRVRFYIGIEATTTSKTAPFRPWSSQGKSPASTSEKEVKDLAAWVAGEL
jgi:hypothetical protein